jgi:GxxExxY protein
MQLFDYAIYFTLPLVKALVMLEDVHLAQALNYLKAYKLEVGLLINFGAKSLEFKRLILTK